MIPLLLFIAWAALLLLGWMLDCTWLTQLLLSGPVLEAWCAATLFGILYVIMTRGWWYRA